MAVVRGNARLLLEEHRRKPFRGSILQLGRALVYLTSEELETAAREAGVELSPVDRVTLSYDPRLADQECIDDQTFFRRLGFSKVSSLDVSDYEGAEILADLNEPLPVELHDRFDVVFDAGTLQHVFHIPEALANMGRAVRVGGRVILGMAASHNHVDHGFYMFSPTLFWDYFSDNAFRIEAARVFEFTHVWLGGRLHNSRWDVYDYTPGCLDALSYGGFGRRLLGIFFVATREPDSTFHRVPQQSYFRRVWERPESLGRSTKGPGEMLPRRISRSVEHRVASAATRHPWLLGAVLAAKRLSGWLRGRRRKRPRLIARY